MFEEGVQALTRMESVDREQICRLNGSTTDMILHSCDYTSRPGEKRQKLTLYPKWSLPVIDEVSCVIFACQMICTMCEVFTVQHSWIFDCCRTLDLFTRTRNST